MVFSAKHMFIIVLIFFLTQSLYIHKHAQYKKHQYINDAVKLYRNDSQIQQILSESISKQPQYLKQFTCSNDNNIKYVVINKGNKNNINNINDQNNDINDKIIKNKKQVVITCNIHARQLITTQVCVDFITQLSSILSANQINTNINKQSNINNNINISNTILNNQNITSNNNDENPENKSFNNTILNNQFTLQQINQLLDASTITVFYRGNDLRDQVLQGNYCIRKDKNNIDINRNFPTYFNMDHFPSSSQQYPGDKPLSQPFSQCLDNYLQSINQTNKVNVYVDIHTGQFTLYDSFQSQNNQTRPILQNMKQKYCPQCRIASLGNERDDDIGNGQIFQDVKKRYGADHSVLLQIYGGYNDNLNELQNCVVIFNPLTRRQLDYYRNIWMNGLLYFVKQALKV